MEVKTSKEEFSFKLKYNFFFKVYILIFFFADSILSPQALKMVQQFHFLKLFFYKLYFEGGLKTITFFFNDTKFSRGPRPIRGGYTKGTDDKNLNPQVKDQLEIFAKKYFGENSDYKELCSFCGILLGNKDMILFEIENSKCNIQN